MDTTTTRLPRPRTLVAALVAGALALTGCNQVEEAVGDAREAVEDGVELVSFCTAAARVAKAISDEDLDAAVSAGQDMVEHAPDDIAGDAKTVLEGAQRARDGDRSAVTTEEFRAAADRVQQYTRDRCDPR